MKKLLLLSSCLLAFAFAGSCQKKQTTASSETKAEVKPVVIQDAAVATDTSKVAGQSTVTGSSKPGPGIKKDSVNGKSKPTAITHPSPEQEKLDSIKKAKLKDQH